MKSQAGVEQIFLFGREFNEGFKLPFCTFLEHLSEYDVKVMIFGPFKAFLDTWYTGNCHFDGIFNHHEDLQGLEGVLFSIS